jgi:hypothetical protein
MEWSLSVGSRIFHTAPLIDDLLNDYLITLLVRFHSAPLSMERVFGRGCGKLGKCQLT